MSTSDPHTPRNTPITLQMIADRCGVALSTVSLALRGRPNVKPKTLERILAVAQELGYDPAQHDMARRLALKKHGSKLLYRTIALLFPSDFMRLRYFAEVYHGIMQGAQTAQYDVLTTDIYRLMKRPDPNNFSPFFRRAEIDGVIISGGGATPTIARALREIPGFGTRPICTLFTTTPGCASICSDEESGIYLATRHLLALGHRHICLFVNVDRVDPHSQQRVAGATRAYAEQGLATEGLLELVDIPYAWYNPAAVPHHPHMQESAIQDALRSRTHFHAFLAAHTEITAIIGMNDASALHAWYACTAAGLRVPDDMSIIGFDDTDSMPGSLGENLLTTVHVPLYDIGMQAAQELFRMIEDASAAPEGFTAPVRLVVRASTAPPRSAA